MMDNSVRLQCRPHPAWADTYTLAEVHFECAGCSPGWKLPDRSVTRPRRFLFWATSGAYIILAYSDCSHSFRACTWQESMASSADKCPVDHKAPAAAQQQADKCPVDHSALTHSDSSEKCPVDHSTRSSWTSIFSTKNDAPAPPQTQPTAGSSAGPRLATDREVSSIPRADGTNWVYPSQAQFYAAMERKNHNPHAPDMKVIVPIHNAVNERAWMEVMKWEAGQGGEKCGGVRLVSFKGRPNERTPRAQWKTLLGCVRKQFNICCLLMSLQLLSTVRPTRLGCRTLWNACAVCHRLLHWSVERESQSFILPRRPTSVGQLGRRQVKNGEVLVRMGGRLLDFQPTFSFLKIGVIIPTSCYPHSRHVPFE